MTTPANPVVAVADLGSNTFHLMVVRRDGNALRVLARERASIRLGATDADGAPTLDEARFDEARRFLERCRDVAAEHDAPLRAFATAAVREARNQSRFLQLAVRAGVSVEVIDAKREASLIGRGVAARLKLEGVRTLVVDIGGGSVEYLVAEDGVEFVNESLPLGAGKLSRRFFPDFTTSPDAIAACRRRVESTLDPVARGVRETGFAVAVFTAGAARTALAMATARNLVALAEGRAPFVPTSVVSELAAIVYAAPTVEERLALAGVEPERAEILSAGFIVLEASLERCGAEGFTYSDYGTRAGAAFEALDELEAR